jgi:putative colanic acid biosynthesis UDP-glucose lipid carrier transferase
MSAPIPASASFTPFRIEPTAYAALGSAWISLAEPLIGISTYLTLVYELAPPITRADWILCLAILALAFPAPQRLNLSRGRATIHIAGQWIQLLFVLWLCAWATGSLELYSLPVVGAWAALTPILWWTNTELTRAVYRWSRQHPTWIRNVILIGDGRLGLRTQRALRKYHPRHALQRISPQDDVLAAIHQHHAHEVYIALEGASEAHVQPLLAMLQNTAASVYVIPDVLHTLVVQGQLQTLDGLPLIAIRTSPFLGVKAVIKRASDLLLSMAILFMIAPLLLLIAIAIKLDSPGPILFFQKRLGANGEPFEVWKFRTMVFTPDETPLSAIPQAIKNDPRVTPIGALLRRTSLDELPQFWNVIRGDMSIVGPRPHALAHHQQYQPLVQAYMVRHSVRPGITGWAQIHGFRGETNTIDKMRRRIEHDIYYLQHWSLALDIHIILRTIGLIFKDAHAW